MQSRLPTTPARKIIALILLTNIIPPLSIDENAASFPHMLHLAGASVPLMQLSITVYMIAFAISQMCCGYCSDRLGRRPTLLLNTPIYLVGTVIAILAQGITSLLIGRFLQGLGVGALALTGPALMGDCFEGDALTRVSSYYSTVYAFIPISAPVLGGFIQEYLGWRANFGLMLLLGLVIYGIFVKFLPETRPRQPRESERSEQLGQLGQLGPSKQLGELEQPREPRQSAISLKQAYAHYREVLTHRHYLMAAICLPLIWSTFVVFSMMAPFILQNTLGYRPSEFGLIALFVGLGFFIGNVINTQLNQRYRSKQIVYAGFFIMLIASLTLWIIALLDAVSGFTLILPTFVMMMGAGFCFPHGYADAVSAIPKHAGIAGALIGSIILVGAVLITTVVTQLHAHSTLAMASVFVALCLLYGIIYHIKNRSVKSI